jgi:hypothetical protein
MANAAPLPKDGLFGVNMVVSAANAGKLTRNVDFFYREGFRSINFYPDVYEAFPAKALSSFRRAMGEFSDYYLELFRRGKDPFTIPSFFSILQRNQWAEESPWWRSCGNLVLGADGRYHACDKAMGLPPERLKDSAVGAGSKVDWKKRDAFYKGAYEYVESRAAGEKFSFCPMGVVLKSRWAGADPEKRMRSFRKIDAIYTSTFMDLKRKLEPIPLFQTAYAAAFACAH